MVYCCCGCVSRSLQPLGAQYSTNPQIGAGVLSGRVLCVPAVCLYIVKTWQESTSQEPAGGARPRASGRAGCVGVRARCPRPAQPPARAGGAPCPFKEADRTTRTFLAGGIRANSGNFQGADGPSRFSSDAGPSSGAAGWELRAGGLWPWASRVSLLRNRPEGSHWLCTRSRRSPSWSKV